MAKTWMVEHGLACGQYPVCVSWSHHRHFIKPRILQPRVSLSRHHQHGLWGSKTNVTPNSKTRILLLAQLVIQSRWLFFSQPQFLSKISKPERLSEAQVGSLIQNQVKCKGRVKLYGVYVLDLRGVWMQKMLEGTGFPAHVHDYFVE